MIIDFHNFGKFLSQTRVHTYETGIEGEGPIRTPYIVLVNDNDDEWHDLVNQHGPFDYYIAISDTGVILSMESDPDQTQFPNVELIGINVTEQFNYTNREGGTVYGKVWDGEAIVDPPAKPEQVPDEISRRQFFQQLAVLEIITREEALSALTAGAIPAPMQAIIDQLPTEEDKFNAQMLVVGASSFNRTHPLAETVRQAMQWTVEQKDGFWLEASKL